MVVYEQWNEFEVYKAGTLTFHALYFLQSGIIFLQDCFHVFLCYLKNI